MSAHLPSPPSPRASSLIWSICWLGGAAAVVAAVVVFLMLAPAPSQASPQSSHGNLNVHVHDDYYHPAGAFLVGPSTDHTLAKAACEAASPAPACNAVIHVGDTITWVSPAPLAVNDHTVTECTDGTFATCGAGVAAGNPIEDSGVRTPPSPGPSGWPYGAVTFTAAGTYYYRCEVHPLVMRGRIVVESLATATAVPVAVGGITEFQPASAAQPSAAAGDDTATTPTVARRSVTYALGGAAPILAALGGWFFWRRRQVV